MKLLALLKETLAEWVNDKCPRLGAAIAYYTLMSLSPLLIIAIAIGGLVFGRDAARGEIVAQIGGLIGEDAALAVQGIVENASRPKEGLMAGVIGVIVLLIGAAGVFIQLQDALNFIWGVRPKPGVSWKVLLQKYFLSFTMVVGTGFLLLVSLVLSASLSSFGKYVTGLLPELLGQIVNLVLSFVVISFLFALMFKFMPDVELTWRDVWLGGALSSFLFAVGKFAIGFYLGHSSVSSAYGAAGSLVVLMIWVYYSTQILLFGVEFTKVYKRHYGGRVMPEPHAEAKPPRVGEAAKRGYGGSARQDQKGAR